MAATDHLQAGTTNTADPKTTVEQFLQALSELDPDRAMTFVAEECAYRNVPFHKANGKARIHRDLKMMIDRLRSFEVEMIHLAVDHNVVLTERVDTLETRFFRAALPLMGVFVVEEGKITEWRDYFDWSYSLGKITKSLLVNPFQTRR